MKLPLRKRSYLFWKSILFLVKRKMPFKSEKQRRYLWKNKPKIASKWTKAYGSKPVKKVKRRKK